QSQHTAPYAGSRLLATSRQLLKTPARAREFVRLIGERYERKRVAKDWPQLQAIRAYSEEWQVRAGLQGIERPKRSFAAALYIPPPVLVGRLRAEAAGTAAPLAPVVVPRGDRVFELDARSCEGGCAAESERYASGGVALSLAGQGGEGSASLRFSVEPGSYAVFVRMKVGSVSTLAELELELDGESVGETQGFGNYLAALPSTAWVWASRAPGLRAARLEIRDSGEHVLTLSSGRGVLVDQLWLSRTTAELPLDNASRLP
ncbi:MAG TPA: hypothetical protein VNN72_02115, partial [Polyangiaceae bacterium]|nr:hypothetical protein [Polyangiaceae bacterium]